MQRVRGLMDGTGLLQRVSLLQQVRVRCEHGGGGEGRLHTALKTHRNVWEVIPCRS